MQQRRAARDAAVRDTPGRRAYGGGGGGGGQLGLRAPPGRGRGGGGGGWADSPGSPYGGGCEGQEGAAEEDDEYDLEDSFLVDGARMGVGPALRCAALRCAALR